MNFKYFPFLFLLSSFLLLTACNKSYISIPKKVNTNRLIVDYYKGENHHLYFVKPALLFENKETNQLIGIDFTYDYKKDSNSLVATKFSIFSPTATKAFNTIDSIIFSANTLTIKQANIHKLLAQSRGKGWEFRYTFDLPYADFTKLMEEENLTMTFQTPKNTIVFEARKSWPAYRDMVNQKLLPAIEFAK